MRKHLLIFVAIITFLISCNTSNQPVNDEKQTAETVTQDYLINATLWYQHSAEMRACYYQAFNWAKVMLNQNLNSDTSSKLPAVVLDIDETLLDNSPFNGFMILENTEYTIEDWKCWTVKAQANALPGAIDFLNYANSLGVEIFYVSNRMVDELSQTIVNMDSLGFPEIGADHFFLKTDSSNKRERRNSIVENYSIILFVGDNLGDFSNDFDERTNNYAFSDVDEQKDQFGSRYIILPNPMYGSWEKGVLVGDGSKSQQRRNHVLGFECSDD
jgi:5'-nucleotidase (lipoprotein e(P4) family)